MKKPWDVCLFLVFSTFCQIQAEAAIVTIGGPGVVLSYRQPVQAIVIDSNGNSFQQTVFYDPAIGGADIDTAWAGPNASVYFPAYGSRYMWYNGFWVDEAGYYWDGGRRVLVVHPSWREHWTGYWGVHNHGGWYHSHPEVSVHINEVNVHESWHGGHRHH